MLKNPERRAFRILPNLCKYSLTQTVACEVMHFFCRGTVTSSYPLLFIVCMT